MGIVDFVTCVPSKVPTGVPMPVTGSQPTLVMNPPLLPILMSL
jgi:hypothetical protein